MTARTWFGLGLALALGLALRLPLCPQFEGIDDFGYLDAARRVATGESTTGSPLFRFRVGMSHPMGWLLRAAWLEPAQFYLLTVTADLLALVCLFLVAAGAWGETAAVLTALLYAVYPLAVAQATMFYPTAFQVAAISAALLCLSAGEKGDRLRSRLTALLSGAVLGLGYLVKEDTALVAVCLGLVALLVRACSLTRVAYLGLGAAIILISECLYYLVQEGDAFYRLASTGREAAPVGDAAIWQWHVYLRTLFVMPYQVGLFWWFGAVAVIAAMFTTHLLPRLLALSLLAVGIYLQFGSASVSSYIPLPKSPRYTAILTPLLILLTAWWLAERRQRRAWACFALLSISALPCIGYAAITLSERTRNTLAILPVLQSETVTVLYTDYYSARALRLLSGGTVQSLPLFRIDLRTGASEMLYEPAILQGQYVLVDNQYCKIYTSSYKYRLPPKVEFPPQEWERVWTRRAYPENTIFRALLEGVRRLSARLPASPVTARVIRNVGDMIDNDRATLYRVGLDRSPNGIRLGNPEERKPPARQ